MLPDALREAGRKIGTAICDQTGELLILRVMRGAFAHDWDYSTTSDEHQSLLRAAYILSAVESHTGIDTVISDECDRLDALVTVLRSRKGETPEDRIARFRESGTPALEVERWRLLDGLRQCGIMYNRTGKPKWQRYRKCYLDLLEELNCGGATFDFSQVEGIPSS